MQVTCRFNSGHVMTPFFRTNPLRIQCVLYDFFFSFFCFFSSDFFLSLRTCKQNVYFFLLFKYCKFVSTTIKKGKREKRKKDVSLSILFHSFVHFFPFHSFFLSLFSYFPSFFLPFIHSFFLISSLLFFLSSFHLFFLSFLFPLFSYFFFPFIHSFFLISSLPFFLSSFHSFFLSF